MAHIGEETKVYEIPEPEEMPDFAPQEAEPEKVPA